MAGAARDLQRSAEHDHQEGAAAVAIRDAEIALAEQKSVTAQLDMQVIAAILNAHQKTVEGKERLNSLKYDVQAAVATRTDLDTPAGARDFQRFLIGKLREIRVVMDTANLDDTSKAALMAAWTALYNIAKGGYEEPRATDPSGDVADRSSTRGDQQEPAGTPADGLDPYLDSLGLDGPGLLAPDTPGQAPAAAAVPSIPSLGWGGAPGQGSPFGGGMPGGLPFTGLPPGVGMTRPPGGLDDELLASGHSDEEISDGEPDDNEPSDAAEADKTAESPAAEPESAPVTGPVTITLPDGETVTAASPQIAGAIKAATAGTPIADAFRQQGIAIPPPGTAVANPVEPSKVTPGDIGMFTDRQALAVGNDKALLNGQIQAASTVDGPSFLGWEHPPAPGVATTPTRTEAPTPTRPAATAGSSQ